MMPAGLLTAAYSGIYDQPVTLTAGRYQGQPFLPGGASRPELTLLTAPWLQADLDADGAAEHVVLLAESSGGSGTFIYLAVMGEDADGFHNLATTLLGDRVEVISLTFADGQLSVTLNDRPATGSTRQLQRHWRSGDSGLQEIVEMAGDLTLGHEVRQFVSCGGKDSLWVLDSTGGALRTRLDGFSLEPYQPLFVVVRGIISPTPPAEFAADYSQQLEILQLLVAEREGFGCRLDLGEAHYSAFGVEPFWRVQVMQDSLIFSGLDMETRVFQRIDVDSQDLLFKAADSSGNEIQLRLDEQPCVNPMSGSLYRFSAQLSVDDTLMNGCAVTALPGR